MLDFFQIGKRLTKNGVEIYPRFIVKTSEDLMIRGGDFYAVWVEDRGLWSLKEQDVIDLIDRELAKYAKEHASELGDHPTIKYMWDAETGMVGVWHNYCQRYMRDQWQPLDENLVFSNTPLTKNMHATKTLPYALENGPYPCWDRLMTVLYSPTERHKIEWTIGAIVTGASKKLQKFTILYGEAGTGKSTVLNVIQELFEGYYAVFEAKSLGSANNQFALEPFSSNPLVAIEHDSDLSKIEDNTRLNSLVSHEKMVVNEKFKSKYTQRFVTYLIAGTNKYVKITDAKSGLLRRLIDVSPSGEKLAYDEYERVTNGVAFELGAIAMRCKEVFEADPHYYDKYIPTNMLGASNDFYNFMEDSYFIFKKNDSTTLKAAWEMYRQYCENANVTYPFSQRVFKEELKNYFKNYYDRSSSGDGERVRSYYSGFRTEKFDILTNDNIPANPPSATSFIFSEQASILDEALKDCKAQYASANGTPITYWDNVTTKLSDLDTKRLHYVMPPLNHIVIDFDIPDETGQKSFEKNLEAASKWPLTYAELSKSGKGIHLHYWYTGDPTRLSQIYDDHIEVKVFSGKSSLRRMLTKCNNHEISKISSGLPLKGDKNLLSPKQIQSERGLRAMIQRNLLKEIHGATKPSVDLIYKCLEDCYKSGLKYDVTDMQAAIVGFASQSTHNADYCLKLCNKMHFRSDEPAENVVDDRQNAPIVFYDVEVFPNLFLVNWKYRGHDKKCVRLINPKPEDIESLLKYRLIGFNNRKYDNHMIYACMLGYTNEQLYKLSQTIIKAKDNKEKKDAMFGEAYNLSYTDIYDFSYNKQSLKKWEIQLHLKHHELGLDWDKPVPEEKWAEVAEYCDDDVINTEYVFDYLENTDFLAREILADLAGMTVNDTTNSLTARIIFGSNRNPQNEFNYRDLGDTSQEVDNYVMKNNVLYSGVGDPKYTVFNAKGQPVFPGYKFENGRSEYRDIDPGEGGYVKANPGAYVNVALLDVTSMHPSSIENEELFGARYTKRFSDLKQLRVHVKHKEFDIACQMFDGALKKWLTDPKNAKAIALALKIAINAVYGQTCAKYQNVFKDPRNKDNIVAKRGALFMINLQFEVEARGFTVAHIKTDSIKIPNATPEIIEFVMDYGKMYGYNFEHEATYDRMCLVNNAVYIARFATPEKCKELYGYVPEENAEEGGKWTATGAEFAHPYIFKTLFSHEPLDQYDLYENKEVSTAMYLDMDKNAKSPDISEHLEFIGRFGSFVPVTEDVGGKIYASRVGRDGSKTYAAISGTKDYYWLESSTVEENNLKDKIDKNYYRNIVDDAINHIKEFCDYNWFISDDVA